MPRPRGARTGPGGGPIRCRVTRDGPVTTARILRGCSAICANPEEEPQSELQQARADAIARPTPRPNMLSGISTRCAPDQTPSSALPKWDDRRALGLALGNESYVEYMRISAPAGETRNRSSSRPPGYVADRERQARLAFANQKNLKRSVESARRGDADRRPTATHQSHSRANGWLPPVSADARRVRQITLNLLAFDPSRQCRRQGSSSTPRCRILAARGLVLLRVR